MHGRKGVNTLWCIELDSYARPQWRLVLSSVQCSALSTQPLGFVYTAARAFNSLWCIELGSYAQPQGRLIVYGA